MYIKDKNGNYVPTPSIKGDDGREVELRATSEYIQWRYEDLEWQNLVSIADLIGPKGDRGVDGSEVSLRTFGRDIQWKLGDGAWQTLLEVDLYSTIKIGSVTTIDADKEARVINSGSSHEAVLEFEIPRGQVGPQGVSGVYVGSGEMPEGYNVQIDPTDDSKLPTLPTGGKSGQVLSKKSNNDYDVEWVDVQNNSIGQEIIDEINSKAAKTVSTAITLLADGWTGEGPYTQMVSIDHLTGDRFENAEIFPEFSDTQELYEEQQNGWNMVSPNTKTIEGNVAFVCYEECPEVDIPLIVKVRD